MTSTASPTPDSAWLVRIHRDERPPRYEIAILSGATQGHTTRGSLSGVFSGLLHNRRELIAQLGVSDAVTDVELVLRAFAKWNRDLPQRLRGIYAIAIWDADSETLLGIRDRLGSHPLFYAEPGGDIVLSTSIDVILEQPGVPSDVHVEVIVDHLRHRWHFPDETYFRSIRRVVAGRALVSTPRRLVVEPYWDPEGGAEIDWHGSEAVERFDAEFDEVVGRFQDLGQPGIFLSGGLDSVSIAAIATHRSRASQANQPIALSLAFPDPACNEEDVQRAVAASLGIRQVMLSWEQALGERDLVDRGLELTRESPAPLMNFWMPAYDALARAGSVQGCRTIMTGSGGDEWLTVSPYYAADLIRTLDVSGLRQLFVAHNRSHNVKTLPYLRNIVWRFGLQPLLAARARAGLARLAPTTLAQRRRREADRSAPEWLAPDRALRHSLIEREVRAREERDAQARRSRASADRSRPHFYLDQLRSGFEHPLVAMELEETYRQGQRLGMRILHPFWDAQLVEFLIRTPPEFLNRDGWSKSPIRTTVSRRFPALGFDRQRKIAATDFARRQLSDLGGRAWDSLAPPSALASIGAVDPSGVGEEISRVRNDPGTRMFHRIWDVVALETWLRARS